MRRVVAEDRLLFFNEQDGWGPQCKFLDCPAPDKPFLNLNKADENRKFMETSLN
jgi:hypothetical protein